MKRVWRSILIVLLVFLAFLPLGIDRSVSSGEYTVHRGETVHGGMFISSPGVVTIEEGARVDGAIFMGSGVLNVNGEVGGGILSISGEIHTGPNAVVNGHATVTSVPFEPNPSTQINNDVVADVSGWMGGPIGAPIVLLALAFYLVYGAAIGALISRRARAAAASDADVANRRAVTVTGGILLIAIGALYLAAALGAEIDQIVFSVALLLPGLLLFSVMLVRGPQDSPMAVAASLLVMTGAVTLYQGVTGHWESWAFAWPLVLPASIGLGRMIEGWWGQHSQRVTSGAKLAGIGVAVFAAAWIFFELLVPASAYSLLYLGIFLLIGIGLYLLITLGRGGRGQPTEA